jgi:hypothetical protein
MWLLPETDRVSPLLGDPLEVGLVALMVGRGQPGGGVQASIALGLPVGLAAGVVVALRDERRDASVETATGRRSQLYSILLGSHRLPLES